MLFFFGLSLVGLALFLTARRRGFFKRPEAWQIIIPPPLIWGGFFLYFALAFFMSFLTWIPGQLRELLLQLTLIISLVFLTGLHLKKTGLKKLLGLKEPDLLKKILTGILSWFVIFPAIFFFSEIVDSLLSRLHLPLPDQVAVSYVKTALKEPFLFALALVEVVFFTPFIEEFLFRALLQNFLKNHLPRLAAILGSSLVFALFHFAPQQGWANLTIILALFLLSLALGFLYEKQKTLFGAIALHAAFNLFTILHLLFFLK
ncbi:MAG: CPBP family intramembrane glutamic endopeptidase [Parachlamydiales bacterium]|jgi:membrane protease YdiL (CAAX protease family)